LRNFLMSIPYELLTTKIATIIRSNDFFLILYLTILVNVTEV